jgi:hypothetical protein
VRQSVSLRGGKIAKGKLRELADDFQSLYVRHRDGWRCRICGSTEWSEMQAAHLFAKGEYHAGRYITSGVNGGNLWCLCFRCHKRYTHQPTEWAILLIQRLGEKGFAELRARCQVRQGGHDYALQAMYYRQLLGKDPDGWKIKEQYDKLETRGSKLGVW